MSNPITLTPSRERSPLALELETFLAHQPAWLVTDRNRYALIKGQDVIGLYDGQDEAFAEGYRRFRREAFMVQRIQEKFDTYYFGGSGLGLGREKSSVPSLKTVMEDMLREGPVLTIRAEPVLAVQKLLQESGEEVPSATLTALVDTGASGTLVQSAVFSQVGIEPFSFAYLRTPSTNEPLLCGKYRVRVVLSEMLAFEVDAVNGALAGKVYSVSSGAIFCSSSSSLMMARAAGSRLLSRNTCWPRQKYYGNHRCQYGVRGVSRTARGQQPGNAGGSHASERH